MPQPKKVTNEQIVDAYLLTGNVWKAAKTLGLCGQSVWERLKAIGHPMMSTTWSAEELAELRLLAGTITISEIAKRLARPYAGVAGKLSELGIRSNAPREKKLKRGVGFNKTSTPKIIAKLHVFDGSLRQFCRTNSLNIEQLVIALQKYAPTFWGAYSKNRSDLGETKCSYCGTTYYPMSAKQKSCTRKCASVQRGDKAYFAGNRRNTVGLDEKTCQLCFQVKEKGLSSHHLLGKENDPEGKLLIALCTGCHQIVGILAGRNFIEDGSGWENLIHLVLMRRMADKDSAYQGSHVNVGIDRLSPEEVTEMFEVAGHEEFQNAI